jgi:hypothetical protein
VYLLYADESGDPGRKKGSSPYFIVAGLAVRETDWQRSLDELVDFRRQLKTSFGIRLKDELHAADLVQGKTLRRLARNDRLSVIRFFARQLASMSQLSLIWVAVDKTGKPSEYDCFDRAWRTLAQRLENTLTNANFPGQTTGFNECGMLLPDEGDVKKLTALTSRMRQFNFVPSRFGPARNLPLRRTIERPSFRDSSKSYFIQSADLAAYLLYQSLEPNSYMKANSGHNYYKILSPIVCRKAAPSDPMGVVRL